MAITRAIALLISAVAVAGCGDAAASSTTVEQPASSTTTVAASTAPTTGVTEAPAEPGIDLTDVRWVTLGPDGLHSDDGTLLWAAGGLFDKAVARDRVGGLVFLEGSDLWWYRAESPEPVHVAGDVPTRVVEVIGGGSVAVLGYGDHTFVRLSDGTVVDDPGTGTVTIDAGGNEVWSAANGWSVWIEGPVLGAAAEGSPTIVESPARLEVADAAGGVVADVVIGTDAEPWVRIHDFDGQFLILSRGPVEPAMPEETFLVIDLGCDRCTSTFTAAATSASLTGADATWSGPAQFSEASLP